MNRAPKENEGPKILERGIGEWGSPFIPISPPTQLSPFLPTGGTDRLKEDFLFPRQYVIDESHTAVRLVTSWATKETEMHRFLDTLKKLS